MRKIMIHVVSGWLITACFVFGAAPAPIQEQGPGPATDETVTGVIKGRVLDYETRRPLTGVGVTVQGLERTAQSDESGAYEISGIPVGPYVLTFQLKGYYSDTRTDVIVNSSRITVLNVQMLVTRMLEEEVEVTADFFPNTPEKSGSTMRRSTEELRRDPGSAGDVSRAMYNIPGVVKADEEANDLIIRGGSPTENGFYIDNIFFPNINHFPQWGASGGNVSMLNIDFIERLDIFTGGFDAAYGNRLSSITDIGYREGAREGIESQLNMSIIGYGAQIEGPLPDKKGSWMVSANRSYLDLVRKLISDDDENKSSYYDFQGKLTYDLGSADRLSLLAIYGHSQTVYGTEYGSERFDQVTAGFNWRHLWGGSGYSDTSLSFSSMKGEEDFFSDSANVEDITLGYRQRWMTLRNRSQIQLGRNHQLKFGFEGQQINFRSLDTLEEDQKNYTGTSGAAFLTYVVYPFHNFSLSSGLRLDMMPFSKNFHLSPRFSFSWILTRRLSVNGAFGMFYQEMPIFLIKQDPANSDLKDPKSRHLVLGLKYLLGRDTQLTLEAYDKQYGDHPMYPGYPYYFMIDQVNGDDARFGFFGSLVDLGAAYSRGVELTLQKKLSRKLYGLFNLTYYRARYRDLMGEWHNRMFDNRFIVCLSGGYKPTKNWEISVRWTYMGNRAFSPVDEELSQLYGYGVVRVESINIEHLRNYQNLSLRVDRRFNFHSTSLVAFAGALNILDHDNELYRYWTPGGYESESMWGIIPYIGFEFEF